MYRLLIPANLWRRLDDHLRAASPSEDGAFMLVRAGRGQSGTRLVIHDLMLPQSGTWEARGQHQLRPTAQWLSAVIGSAIETTSGVAFVHSHPNTAHPPSLSPIDHRTSLEWSRSLSPMLERPFLSLVWTPTGLSGLVFEPSDPSRPAAVDLIEIVGEGAVRRIHPTDKPSAGDPLDDRQARALGALGNARLRQLSVALIGVGGTGSPLAEQLARMGVRQLMLIDPDVIDTASNLRRLVGARPDDLQRRRHKVDVVKRHVQSLGLGVSVTALAVDIRTEAAARAVLDADLAIASTDTHGSRSFVNQLAYQYYLPVIDVGTRVGVSPAGAITGMPVDVRLLLPDTGCLWCRSSLDAGIIRAENLPAAERDREVREGYVQGIDAPQPSLAALNAFAASLASLAMLRVLAGDDPSSGSFIADGWERYVVDQPAAIAGTCLCRGWRGMADDVALAYLPGEEELPSP